MRPSYIHYIKRLFMLLYDHPILAVLLLALLLMILVFFVTIHTKR